MFKSWSFYVVLSSRLFALGDTVSLWRAAHLASVKSERPAWNGKGMLEVFLNEKCFKQISSWMVDAGVLRVKTLNEESSEYFVMEKSDDLTDDTQLPSVLCLNLQTPPIRFFLALFRFQKYQKQRNHNVIFLFRYCPRWLYVRSFLPLAPDRNERKNEQTKIPDILNNLHAFFPLLPFRWNINKKKRWNIHENLYLFMGWNVKVCVMSVMCFYSPLRAREEMIY